ncbi:hypothetical protein AAW14_06210 [Streptomyces hygroscopicus]|uniref:hypothetical protein n=1 Tax=Streptomyces hygroscopicus TaxID=1912 RepID=UPI0022405765|nr:hypothetical protein [Streptomyces hygroscopicus]MCW7941636.1 hypothetical protein [Streptomyces hygroscopicus]
MTTDPQRPEVDDPRVLALAKARQQLAYENPFNAVCPPWEGLTEKEQHLSLLDARSYLHAAIKAGLAAVSAPVQPPTRADDDRRDRYAQAIRDSNGTPEALAWWKAHPQLIPAAVYADAAMALADAEQAATRADVLREFLSQLDERLLGCCEECNACAAIARDLAAELAGEEQPATEAQPPHHRWYVETRDGVADQWAPGWRFTDRAEAVDRYQTVTANFPTWKDGTPVQRRFVRETTTYTVEEPT